MDPRLTWPPSTRQEGSGAATKLHRCFAGIGCRTSGFRGRGGQSTRSFPEGCEPCCACYDTDAAVRPPGEHLGRCCGQGRLPACPSPPALPTADS